MTRRCLGCGQPLTRCKCNADRFRASCNCGAITLHAGMLTVRQDGRNHTATICWLDYGAVILPGPELIHGLFLGVRS